MKNAVISVIIVYYRAKKELFECIYSLLKSKANIPFEIIVVDNDRHKTIGREILGRFPKIKYIKSSRNIGYGAGNNFGASKAKGEYLFFLNPDTRVYHNTVDILYRFINKDKAIGVASPLLLDRKQKPYPLQGSQELTPLRAIICFSFLNRFLPNNPISRSYFLLDWNKKDIRKVDTVPGTAFLIRRAIFEKIGRFDERFFLFFEEDDICRRVKKLGFTIYINPKSKIIHLGGVSTKTRKDINEIFLKSRFLYFRKHFGFLSAFVIHNFLNIRKTHIFLCAALFISAFLRFYRLPELMQFIGDQGWFYLSARDMILTGNIPLVGITSSHTWLHQGPLWTYMLAGALLIGNFNPLSGAYITAFIGIFSVFFMYKIGTEFFSKKFGLIAALIYSTSPLVIFHDRMPYHTSLIPFFVLLLFYSLIKWSKGSAYYLPLAVFLMSILYNLHLATIVFWPVIIFLLVLTKLRNTKIIILSLFALIIPMLPILIYDLSHGFPQTLKYGAWFIYKFLQTAGFIEKSSVSGYTLVDTFSFFFEKYNLLTVAFLPRYIAFVVFEAAIVFFLLEARKNKIISPFNIIFYSTIISVIAYFFSNTPSEAYLVMLFPGLIFLLSYTLNKIKPLIISIGAVLFISLFNTYSFVASDFLMENRLTLQERIDASKKIVSLVDGKEYNLIGKGSLSDFESYTMNYKYLAWFLGNGPVKEERDIKIYVAESKSEIRISKSE